MCGAGQRRRKAGYFEVTTYTNGEIQSNQSGAESRCLPSGQRQVRSSSHLGQPAQTDVRPRAHQKGENRTEVSPIRLRLLQLIGSRVSLR